MTPSRLLTVFCCPQGCQSPSHRIPASPLHHDHAIAHVLDQSPSPRTLLRPSRHRDLSQTPRGLGFRTASRSRCTSQFGLGLELSLLFSRLTFSVISDGRTTAMRWRAHCQPRPVNSVALQHLIKAIEVHLQNGLLSSDATCAGLT